MRTHWKKILLLIVLAVAAQRSWSANVAVWPDAGGGGGSGTQLDTEYALIVQDTALSSLSLASNTWTHADSAGITWSLSANGTSACFEEVTDGVLRYTCADSRVCEFRSSALVYGATLPALTYVNFRTAYSTDNGSTFGVFGGTAAQSTLQITADSEYSAVVQSVITQEINQNERFRFELRQAGSTANAGVENGRISVLCPGGTRGTDGTDADFATDGATNTNVLTGQALVSTEASSTTLSTLDMSGSIITNLGAAGSVTYTLGTGQCSVGMQFTVLNAEDGQTIVLEPYSTVDQIINLTDAAGDSVTSDGVSTSAISCQCIVMGKWFCTRSGSWTDTN